MSQINRLKKAACAVAVFCGVTASAVTLAGVDPKVEKAITENLQSARPDIVVSGVEVSPVAGIYQVKINGSNVLYVTETGSHFFAGDIYKVKPGGFVNLTEEERNVNRVALMSEVKKDETIVFSPKGEVKASVSVFTDVDCGYCQKLHQEIPKYNELGIEIRYLAYPRAGIGSESYRKIASAWCADKPSEALTKLKSRQPIPINVCEKNPVPKQFELGHKVGVTGTPALVLESGRLVPGYMPADRLAKELGI